MLLKECKEEQGMGGERSKRKGQGMECKKKKTTLKKKTKQPNPKTKQSEKQNKKTNKKPNQPQTLSPSTSQSLFLLQKCKFIYIFRSWNVVVTY